MVSADSGERDRDREGEERKRVEKREESLLSSTTKKAYLLCVEKGEVC